MAETEVFYWAMLKVARVFLGCVIAGLIGYAYFVRVIDENHFTACSWLIHHWKFGPNYSHGPLIALIVLGLVYWKRGELLRCRLSPSRTGLWIVLFAMLVYYVGVKAVQQRFVVLSFVLLLYGLALALGGREVFRVLFFPITFLLLMIPLNFLDEQVGFPLQILMAKLSTTLLNWMGIDAWRSGTAVHSGVFPFRSGLFDFEVAAQCSGIRSLMALTTVTAAYAYVTQRQQWKRWVLFLSAAPLAVLGNLVRVTSTGLAAQVYGQQVALKAYHDFSGYIVYGVALAAMVGFGFLLDFPYRRVFERWLRPIPAHHESASRREETILADETHE